MRLRYVLLFLLLLHFIYAVIQRTHGEKVCLIVLAFPCLTCSLKMMKQRFCVSKGNRKRCVRNFRVKIDDVSSILRRLYLKSGMDLERCKYGIVYVDEIDKIMSKVSRSNESDAVGTGVQQNFLKLMEGGSQTFKMPQNGNIVEVTIDTGNILFVFGGAFVGIENTKKPSRSIGFTDGVQQAEISNKITQDDIIKYGFIPEFIGRVPIIVTMERLTREDLKSILISTPKSILHQYKELFALDGIQASFDDALVNEILDGAVSQNTGARGLRGVVEKDIMKLMFEVAKYSNIKNLHITRELLDAPQKSLKSIAKEQQSKEDRISYPEPKALKLS